MTSNPAGPRILYLSYDGMTDPLGQSQVLPYLEGLAAKGYRFTLVSFEKPEAFERGRSVVEGICARAGIRWMPQRYTKRPPVLSTVKDVRKMTALARRLHRAEAFSAVHCRSYIAALAGLSLKRHEGVPFLFDMRGFWADERVDGGLWNLRNPLFAAVYRFFKSKEKEFLQEADAVVSLTYAAREEMARWPLTKPAPVSVVPCCVDTTLFDPERVTDADLAAKRSALSLPQGTPVLGYVGSLGTWYRLPEMLAFFRRWRERFPGAVMLFVTTEPRDTILAEAARQNLPVDAFRITPSPRGDMPQYIALMDWGIFFLERAYSKIASSPVKQGELMAMGIPVICNTGVGDSDRIVSDYQAGMLVEEYRDAAYDSAVAAVAAGRPSSPAEIRAGCLQYFDLKAGVDAYAEVYRSILPSAS